MAEHLVFTDETLYCTYSFLPQSPAIATALTKHFFVS